VIVRRLEADDRVWLRERLHEDWGDEAMAGHGELFFPADHEGFVADGRGGVVTYRMADEACEITMIESYEPGRGIGSALLNAVIAEARAAGCRRIWLVTTNDNEHAQRWYAARGFAVTEVRPGAVDEARRTLKPTIPEVGRGGVPITDELELSLVL
jgi:ribosomal protein S18 acetylase RimI-like enzyme